MTDRIALWLFALILLGLGLDYYFAGMDGLIFLGAKLGELIEWMAFWR
ncbi:hypothetical protein [Roseovarius aquimarinus]|uniref:Glyceraldehyde-3-phosphate dehydrogenase n=1 Tax=Roseovarius aquimarinus TaxID=1229156 RepID=A0ABW7I2Y9_9RHOB